MHERRDHRRCVVDAFEEHRLAAKRNARIGKPGGRFVDFRGQLLRMGEMDTHPQGMMLLQHFYQVFGDPLRQYHRDLGSDANELNMLDRPQPA